MPCIKDITPKMSSLVVYNPYRTLSQSDQLFLSGILWLAIAYAVCPRRIAPAPASVVIEEIEEPLDPVELDRMILSILEDGSLPCRKILIKINKTHPAVTRSEVNSRLYTMLNRKLLLKSSDKRLIWSMR